MSKAQMPRELRDQLITVQRVAEAIIETVNECPQGAPAGPMYAAMMQFMSLDTRADDAAPSRGRARAQARPPVLSGKTA
jgi:hypothetical protein